MLKLQEQLPRSINVTFDIEFDNVIHSCIPMSSLYSDYSALETILCSTAAEVFLTKVVDVVEIGSECNALPSRSTWYTCTVWNTSPKCARM